jgi:L-rhamnose mutarotase
MEKKNIENMGFNDSRLNGYIRKDFPFPVKRYCQTLELKDDPELIREYMEWHAKVWPEVLEGIKKVGILDHEIYIHGNTLFMILVTPVDFDFDRQMSKLATLPRQAEWEEFMSKFQKSDPSASSSEKWVRMERIFKLH